RLFSSEFRLSRRCAQRSSSCSVAWTSRAYPPDFTFHPGCTETGLDVIEEGSESATPQFVRERLVPGRTIAKENRERKEKSQEKAEKIWFFVGGCGNPSQKCG